MHGSHGSEKDGDACGEVCEVSSKAEVVEVVVVVVVAVSRMDVENEDGVGSSGGCGHGGRCLVDRHWYWRHSQRTEAPAPLVDYCKWAWLAITEEEKKRKHRLCEGDEKRIMATNTVIKAHASRIAQSNLIRRVSRGSGHIPFNSTPCMPISSSEKKIETLFPGRIQLFTF